MENIIIFGIIIVSVIVNIVKNFKKESENNAKRVIVGKKPEQLDKPVTVTTTTNEDTPYSFNTSETYELLEYDPQTVQSRLESSGLTTSDYIAKYNVEVEEMTDDSSESDEKGRSSISIALDGDGLKKAVLYSTILERKF